MFSALKLTSDLPGLEMSPVNFRALNTFQVQANDARSIRAAENRTVWMGVVAKSSVVPQRHCKVMG